MISIIPYIKRDWIPLCMVLIPSGLFLGPMPFSMPVYYGWLIFLGLLSFVKRQQISKVALCFMAVCALSILFGSPSPIFKSWERLALFVILLSACFPVFRSDYFAKLRARAFPLMLMILGFTSVGSFIAYFLGINYMTKAFVAFADSVTVDTIGWFGGLTYQSMMLGPICALALTFFVWLLIEKEISKQMKWIVWLCAFSTLCCMMLTASRSANAAGLFGVIVVLFLKYRSRLGKMIKLGIIIGIGAIVLSPVYMPYADKVLSKQRDNEAAGSSFASREDRWEHRIEEFSQYPIFGYGFVAVDTQYVGEYMPSTGIIEPGSSWLAILSMTGTTGLVCFLIMLLSTVSKLYAMLRINEDGYSILHIGLLGVFAIHFIAEGYIFSGGGALAFLFWFVFGCAYSYSRTPMTYCLPFFCKG